jgi:uncharacterized membrane protein
MTTLQGAVLVAATLAMGMMAGVFFAYTTAVMPGLRRTDDRTFVAAFQWIDRSIVNPVFLSLFLGALPLTGLAAVLFLVDDDGGDVAPWTIAAFVLYLYVVVSTLRVNMPRNDATKQAGDPDEIADLAAVRQRFGEDVWTRWNHIRTLASTAALGCLAWALAEYGRGVL